MDDQDYEARARLELAAWREAVLKPPGLFDKAAKNLQGRVNRLIPEKVHAVITGAIEQMTRALLTGADFTAPAPLAEGSLEEREERAAQKIKGWTAAAAAEGGITGAGGFLASAADFPLLIAIKIKMLFDIAAIYGHDGSDFRERLYILNIFQLAFSSADWRREVLDQMVDWDERRESLPTDWEAFDWRRFQQEYRDHIDLAKLAQMLPVVGAPVGAFVNYRLLDRLGETALAAYRLRWFSAGTVSSAHG